MKTGRLTALLLAALVGCSWGRPVDLSAPGGELGAANAKGYLELWQEVDEAGVQLGNSYLPLRFKFSSDPSVGGVLGPGFSLPIAECRNVLIREGTMRAYLPCGKGLYFWRTNLDPNKFLTPDKEWTGYATGEDFTVWRDDGWKVAYHQGRLTSITTDDKRVFTWTYGPTTDFTGTNWVPKPVLGNIFIVNNPTTGDSSFADSISHISEPNSSSGTYSDIPVAVIPTNPSSGTNIFHVNQKYMLGGDGNNGTNKTPTGEVADSENVQMNRGKALRP